MLVKKNLLKGVYFALALCSLFAYTNCSSPNHGNQDPDRNSPAAAACFDQLGTNSEWSNETEVPIMGYSGNAMEPQISADGTVLLFNNKTGNDTEMDIHWAVLQNGNFVYGGVLSGANAAGVLDGVPATDSSNNFYFVSLRNYGQGSPARYRSLYGAQFSTAGGLSLVNVAPADSALPDGPGPSGSTFYVDMDLGLSWDGTKAVVARAKFSDGKGYPDTSKLELFNVNTTTRALTSDSNSASILQNINIDACRIYAPTLSLDQKELFYTVLAVSGSSTFNFKMVVAKRNNTTEAFGPGSIINGITGQTVEGPSISYHDGGKTLFYHKLDTASGKFKIFKVTRP
jgi:hypothetical protein